MPGQLKQLPMIIILSMVFYLLCIPFAQYPLTTLLKTIPIILLILLTLQTMAKSKTRTLLITALFFSLLGDAVLTGSADLALYFGILFFLLAQMTYICLFLQKTSFQGLRVAAFIPIATLIFTGFIYIWPSFGDMKVPVAVYAGILSFMVLCSFQVRKNLLLTAGGATLFMISDFIFAINEFVLPSKPELNILIMSLYYAAQFLLVRGISSKPQTAMGALMAGCD